MKAITYTTYGSPDVLQLTEIEKPTPRENDLLIKVHATGLNAADWRMMRADPFFVRFIAGLRKPKNQVLGVDIAGRVEAVGTGVTRFKVGDAVYADLSGIGFGGLAEYACVPEEIVALKPRNLTFEQAAAVPMAAVTALQGLRDIGRIQTGDKVLINGASGGVGTFAVQIAKSFGATVTAVCSTSKMAQARSVGADHVIDYTQEDFANNGQQYDLILAVNGNRALADYLQALTPTGRYVVVGGAMSQVFAAILLGPFKSKKGGKTIKDFTAKVSSADLATITTLLEAEKVVPIIDRRYPLNETPDAIRYLEQGHAKGKVIITITRETKI
ncbi:MAG: NAD(P)-dependent alcohol dehydrogenase [Candidatus Promineifilaceae bacterium]